MQRLEEQLQIETKIKQGAQSMLKVKAGEENHDHSPFVYPPSKKSFYEEGKGSEPNTEDVELQLKAAESKIAALTMQLAALKAGGAKRRKSLLHTSSNVAGGIHRRSTSSQNLSSRSSPARPRNGCSVPHTFFFLFISIWYVYSRGLQARAVDGLGQCVQKTRRPSQRL